MISSINGLTPISKNEINLSDRPRIQRGQNANVDPDQSKSDSLVKKDQLILSYKSDETNDQNRIAKASNNEETEKLTEKNLDKIKEKLNSLLEGENLSIDFSKDKETEKVILKLIDPETDEVIKQFPPEIALKISKIVSSMLEKQQVENA